ncbi:TIM-barrel domain-containing protein [Micromonospora sp. M12]
MLRRLRERDLKVCVWINPYVAQRRTSSRRAGRPATWCATRRLGLAVGQVAGRHGARRLHQPDAVRWFTGKLKALLDMGVDCFKTDFGERIPTDVVWHDGSDPQRMHNYYSYLYNKAVFELLETERGKGEAVLFARSATAGGQQFPVHWGGDCESTFVAMAESLRGGLSLAASGFGYWSHDIGGFEGTPTRRCSSGGWPSGCSPRTPGCTVPARTGCRGRTTTRPSTCCGTSRGSSSA